MHLALNLVRARPDRMAELAARAEQLGYESVFVPDHLALPVQLTSAYPGTSDGSFPYPRDTPLYDPWIVLMQIAQATSSIKLGTAIYLLALRHPIAAARAITTLDVLSRGRALLGIGVGWCSEEFRALGIDPRTRGGRTDEAIEALRRLWTEAEPEYHGKHFDFDAIYFTPRPVSTPHPPILVGGDSEPAMKRAARLGDGWMSGGVAENVDEIAGRMQRLRALRAEYGATRPFSFTVLDANPGADALVRMAEIGVDRVVVMPWASNRDAPAAIESFAKLARSALGR
jgi:probable F420-dependent oxidoreductase